MAFIISAVLAFLIAGMIRTSGHRHKQFLKGNNGGQLFLDLLLTGFIFIVLIAIIGGR